VRGFSPTAAAIVFHAAAGRRVDSGGWEERCSSLGATATVDWC
jgi:hypothetical protein